MTEKQILKLKVTHFHIKKGGYYYKPGSCGYTEYRINAGVYTKEEAIKHLNHCKELDIVSINPITHNKEILDEVKSLLNRII